YQIAEYDAYSKYAYIRVATPNSTDPSVLAAVTNNLAVKGNGNELNIASRDASNGIITLSGLTPATDYSITSSITGTDKNSVWNNNGNIITETESPVPNGDFEDLKETINTTINQGGLWTITTIGKTHQTTLLMNIKEPQGWVSSNSLTCNLNANNKNSWYLIPSVYNTSLSWKSHQPEAKGLGIGQSPYDSTADIYKDLKSQSKDNAMIIRNVAWDFNGPSIADKKQTGNTDFSNYFCSNKPSSIANRTAGYMYLGTATEQGANFASRPTKLKGFYKYENDSLDKEEKGKITVEILNGDKLLGSGQIELGANNDYTEFTIPIKYSLSMFQPKATKLKIYITSSNKTSDIKTTDYCNKDECCSRGAVLTVDNLTFEY
ncbi:MAG: PCMD domain-containing protein, partial [Muribaculaceae bacterium]|nr:PCMD domain-containing protein [Muribaculaceae bacterium]